MIVSTKNLLSNGTLQIREVVPITKRILKILECDNLWKRNIQKKFISIW